MKNEHEAVLIRRRLIEDGLRKDPKLRARYVELYDDYRKDLTKWVVSETVSVIVLIVIINAISYLVYPFQVYQWGVCLTAGALLMFVMARLSLRSTYLNAYRMSIENTRESD